MITQAFWDEALKPAGPRKLGPGALEPWSPEALKP